MWPLDDFTYFSIRSPCLTGWFNREITTVNRKDLLPMGCKKKAHFVCAANRFTVYVLNRFQLKCVFRSMVRDALNDGMVNNDTSYVRYLRWRLLQEVRMLVTRFLPRKNYWDIDIVLNQVGFLFRQILPKILLRHRLRITHQLKLCCWAELRVEWRFARSMSCKSRYKLYCFRLSFLSSVFAPLWNFRRTD